MLLFTLALLGLISVANFPYRCPPPITWLRRSAMLPGPAILFYGCLTLSFPQVLALTFFTGLINDLLTVPLTPESNFSIGTSILLLLIPALIMHGFSSTFLRGRWFTNFMLA